MKTKTLRFRAEPEFKEKLKKAVENRKAKNISDLIRKALEQFLSKNGE